MLPNFLIIGAAKSGTTSLYEQLRRHPDVCMPPRRWKEPTFFSDGPGGRWSRGLDWYRTLFSHHRGERAVGEASTSYTKAPFYGDAADKIAGVLPEVRLIYLVRDPVEQIISHYRHLVFFEGVRTSFVEALENDGFLLESASYATQLEPYFERFPPDRIRVVPFERYVEDPVREARSLCRFLDIDDSIELRLPAARNASSGRRLIRLVHSARAYRLIQRGAPNWGRRMFDRLFTSPLPRPSPEGPFAERIRERLEPEVRALESMTGLDLEHWRHPN